MRYNDSLLNTHVGVITELIGHNILNKVYYSAFLLTIKKSIDRKILHSKF